MVSKQDKVKVYIYDPTKAHSRLILTHYKDTFNFVRCTKSANFSIKDTQETSVAFVFVSNSEDILKLHYIKSNVREIFLGSNKKNIDYSLYKLKGVTYLNMFETKTDLLNYIDFKLTELGLLNKPIN